MSRKLLVRTRWGRLMVLYRAHRNWGVREMAKATGISAATLSRIERGHAMDAATLLTLWHWFNEPHE